MEKAPPLVQTMSRSLPRSDDRPYVNNRVAGLIEHALCQVGDFGEVRLVVVKGRLRFIQVLSSETVNEDQP